MKPTLLLLPGMLCDGAFWRAQTEALAELCTPVVPSYGQADTIEAMALAVLANAPDWFAVAGHSMGGRVALEIVKRASSRVGCLGLFCTDYRAPPDEASRAEEAANGETLVARARADGVRSLAHNWFSHLVAPETAADQNLMQGLTEMGARHSLEQLAVEIHAGLTRQDYAKILPRITCPTLVCTGEKDPLRTASLHAEMAARIPGARLLLIPGAGHMVAMEQPQAVTATMREWLVSSLESA